MNILAIGAHPDDIEIFMYGILAACKKRGDKIHLAVATDGAGGVVESSENLIQVRKKETIEGLELIGQPRFLDLPDGKLSFTSSATEKIDNFIKKINPNLIITHSPEDYHPDHRALSRLLTNEIGFKCPIIFADTLMGVNFIPDFYVDITDHFEDKKKAILKHNSQNPKKLLEAVKIWNRFRAAQCNAPSYHFAEAYRVLKRFPFSDIREFIPAAPKYRPFNIGDRNSLI